MVLATSTECAKTMGLALLCQPFAWNTSYFTIMHGVTTSFCRLHYTLWQSYGILASFFALVLHLMLYIT